MNAFARLYDYIRTEGMGRALRHRDFTLFSITSWISTLGMWMQRIAVGWLTWELTHSGIWLGLMAAAQALPAVFLLPFTGAFADRVDRLKLIRVTQALTIFANTLLAVMVIEDWVTVELMFAVILFSGVVMTFNMPARMTLAPSLVPRADLSAAIAVGSFIFTSAMFVGPAVAGLLIDHGGVGLAFAANAVSYLPFYAILYVITLRDRDHRASKEAGLLADMMDGIRYTRRHVGIGPVLIMAVLISILLRPLSDMAPGFVDVVFGAGASALGLMLSALGIGGMTGSLWMANRGRIEGSTRIYFVANAVAAIATIIFASTSVLWIAIVCMAVIGFFQSASGNAAQSLIQGSVEPSHRARVISLYSLTHRAGPAIGAMAIGWASHAVGLQVPVAVGAGVALILVLWVARRSTVIAASLETIPPEEYAPVKSKAAE